MPTVTVQATVDALVSENFPTKNYGDDAMLTVNAGEGIARVGFIHWNQPFPLGVTIIDAYVVLRQKGAATGGSREVRLQRSPEAWREHDITFENRPAPTGTIASRTLGDSATDGREWLFDVTALMQQVSDGSPWYGVRVTSDNSTMIRFYPREAGPDLAPTLVVTYSDAPDAPTQLAPSGGRSVSLARPTLRFGFVDPVGTGELAGFQIQRHTSNSWTSPVYDSGEVASPDPEWIPPTDLPTDEDIWWRVRVRNSAGIWSPWSDAARFRRTAKPVITITAPDAGVIYQPLPTFAWTVSGGVQVRRQLAIVDPDDSTDVLYTTGVVTTAVGAVTLPSSQSRLLVPGQDYRLVVRVWDDVSRESTPGDPSYAETSLLFTFQPSPAVDPVVFVTATIASEGPFLIVSTARDVAPDELVFLVDGRTVATHEAAAISTGGVGYQVELRDIPVRRDVVVSVAAQVGDAMSVPVAADPVRLEPKGLWLYSLEPGGPAVCLATDGPIDADTTEVTAMFDPPASPNLVLVTQRRGGLRREGLNAWLEPGDLEAWEELEGIRVETLGMSTVDQTWRAQIWNAFRMHQNEGVAWGGDDTIPVTFSWASVS